MDDIRINKDYIKMKLQLILGSIILLLIGNIYLDKNKIDELQYDNSILKQNDTSSNVTIIKDENYAQDIKYYYLPCLINISIDGWYLWKDYWSRYQCGK